MTTAAAYKSWATRRANGWTPKTTKPMRHAAGIDEQRLDVTRNLNDETKVLSPDEHAAVTSESFHGWRVIQFSDIPNQAEFERITLDLLHQGVTNSDRIRDHIRRQRKLILSNVTGNWNDNASDKFVNEHAWTLKHLVEQGVIELVSDKEYQLT